MKVILDTNVVVAAIQPGSQSSRRVLEWCFKAKLEPQLSNALLFEYEEVTRRRDVMRSCRFNREEAEEFIDAIISVSQWVEIYYGWRPNLPDENDNHLVELAVAAGARYIITHNTRDLIGGEMHFNQLDIVTPSELIDKLESGI